jgi:hypothetical protein
MRPQDRKNKVDEERAAELRRLQAYFREHVSEGRSLVDELLEERCREVAREWQEAHGYGSFEYWLQIVRKKRGMTAGG